MSLYLKTPSGLTKRDERRRRLETLCPDGVPIDVVWDDFAIGTSVFIPAINTTKLIDQVKRRTAKLHWDMVFDIRIESGKWGVRFWRSL